MHHCACGHELDRHLGGNVCGQSQCGCRGFRWTSAQVAVEQPKTEQLTRRIFMPGGF